MLKIKSINSRYSYTGWNEQYKKYFLSGYFLRASVVEIFKRKGAEYAKEANAKRSANISEAPL